MFQVFEIINYFFFKFSIKLLLHGIRHNKGLLYLCKYYYCMYKLSIHTVGSARSRTRSRLLRRQGHAAGCHAALAAQGGEAGQLPGAGRLQPGEGGEGDPRALAPVHVRAEDAGGQAEPEPRAQRVQHTDGDGRGQGGTLQGGPVVQHLGPHQGLPGRAAAQPRPGRLQRRKRRQY